MRDDKGLNSPCYRLIRVNGRLSLAGLPAKSAGTCGAAVGTDPKLGLVSQIEWFSRTVAERTFVREQRKRRKSL